MKKVSASFISGAVALVFAVIGYQTALLVHYSAVARIAANRDHPDTVYVAATAEEETYAVPLAAEPEVSGRGNAGTRSGVGGRQGAGAAAPSGQRNAGRGAGAAGSRSGRYVAETAQAIRRNAPRKVESFRFNPNTASVEDLQRLGFSLKQAHSIDAYRSKGGRFRRKSDFAKSFVVSDSIYHRLEKYIDIPKLDLNAADSAAFDTLPGIGGYFAAKMVEHRSRLRGYSYPEQLMDIYHFDEEKFDALKDLVFAGECDPYPLWTLPQDSLARHPYIRSAARGIVFFREHNSVEKWTVEDLAAAGVLSSENASKLSRCRIAGTIPGDIDLKKERKTGLEPATFGLGSRRSTD